MTILASNTELWAIIGTTVVVMGLLIVPGLVFAWIVLQGWVADGYDRVLVEDSKP